MTTPDPLSQGVESDRPRTPEHDERAVFTMLITDSAEFTVKTWSPVNDVASRTRYLSISQTNGSARRNFTFMAKDIDELERLGKIIANGITHRRDFEPSDQDFADYEENQNQLAAEQLGNDRR